MRKHKKWIILSLSVIIIAILSYYIFSILQFGGSIQDVEDEEEAINDPNPIVDVEQPKPPPEWKGKERVNILLLGIDAREADAGGNARSDTMMVVSVDPITKQANLFSIMRDTFVAIPGRSKNKINAAHAFGGAKLAMQTVGEFLDVPIHYYVSIDFEGFIKLVDALGGIEFEVEKNMRHYDPTDDAAYNIDLKKGLQHLDGSKALQYVRFRNDTLADYTRTARQRNIMQAVAKEMLTISSLLKLPSTLEKIEPYIKTNMSLNQMWALGNLGYRINTSNIKSEQLPPSHLLREETTSSGAEIITVDLAKLQAFVQSQFEPVDAEENTEDNDER